MDAPTTVPQVEEQDPIQLPTEERMEKVLAFAFFGIHHCGDIKKSPEAWRMVTNTVATWDFDQLTRLVVAAHKYGVRVQISPASPRDLRITLHPRKTRTGSMSERHPTLGQAIEKYANY